MKKNENKNTPSGAARKDAPGHTGRVGGADDAVPGINTPGIELPAFNPPVPNRAWTAMMQGLDIDALSEEEKRELYYGRDDIF